MSEQTRRSGLLRRRPRSDAGDGPPVRTNGSTAVPLDPGGPSRAAGDGDPHAVPSAAPAGPPGPERPRLAGPLEAFMRHPVLTLLPLVLLVAGAVYIGTQRDPEHEADARIAVGNTNVQAFLLQEVVTGNQALAASYSRAIDAPDVSLAAARAVGIPPAAAAERLSGSPVPGSTLINVEATGPNGPESIALANAGADALIDYVKKVNTTDEADDLFRRYQKAQAKARRAEQRTQRLLRSSRRNSPAATEARIEQDAAALKASDLANRYRAATVEANSASKLTLIGPANESESDRDDVLEQLLLIGAIAGLVLGLALALLRTNWPVLRSLRRA